MTELELYKFIQDENLELDWRGEQLVLWVDFYPIKDFARMIRSYLEDGGIDVNLQENCIALDIVPLCEYFDIAPENIRAKDESY